MRNCSKAYQEKGPEKRGAAVSAFVHLSSHSRIVQVLSSLPNMTASALRQFERAVISTNSVKEQRVAVRALLLGGAGGQLRALAPQKAGNVITNLTG